MTYSKLPPLIHAAIADPRAYDITSWTTSEGICPTRHRHDVTGHQGTPDTS